MECHWNEKESWIAPAIYAGGTGVVLCDNCEHNNDESDHTPCRSCPEAIRQFPGQPEEHFNWRECGCEKCREMQKKYLPKSGVK